MKRVITIKGNDGDVQLEIRATVKTSALAQYENQRVVDRLANRLFNSIDVLPYSTFGVHNTEVVL